MRKNEQIKEKRTEKEKEGRKELIEKDNKEVN